jgi:hypothetical protein
MDEELSAELSERAGRDQAARMSLRPGRAMAEWVGAMVWPATAGALAAVPEADYLAGHRRAGRRRAAPW